MPSSPLPYFRETSPSRTSQFTYRHLAQLAAASPSSPLRVIAHVDLDAFYAQCEMRRLDVADDQPLAVQQWYVPTLLAVVAHGVLGLTHRAQGKG
jgi:DNA polymerase eta